MPEIGSIPSFNVGLKALIDNNDPTILQQIVKETLAVCPPHRTQTAKGEIAAILQRKYLLESRRVSPSSLPEIDKKYYDLSITLKTTPLLGREIPSRDIPQIPIPSKPQLPAKPGTLAGLAPVLLKGWLEKKKPLIKATAMTGAAMCGLFYLYNKIWGPSEKKKIPIDRALLRQKELQNFEKTVKSLEHIRAFSRLSRNPNLSGHDYSAVLKNPGKIKKVAEKEQPLSSKLAKWGKEESSLFKEIDQTAKLISTPPPKRKRDALTFDEEPLPKLSKFDTSPIFGFGEQPAKKIKTRKPRKQQDDGPSEGAKSEIEESKEPLTEPTEPVGKIVPVTKRAKKVRKITEEETN